MLISEFEVQSVIDRAEQELNECYNILYFFKPASGTHSNNIAIEDFQPKLAECLYSLMVFYQKLHEEKRTLISNKQSFADDIFRERMKMNALYQHVVSDTIKIGKALGDAFAWFFFSDNRGELEKHMQHESTGLFTNGIGGLGEVEFIKNNQFLNGMMVIYHSITNMLRIGDFSLYDFKKGIVGTNDCILFKVNLIPDDT